MVITGAEHVAVGTYLQCPNWDELGKETVRKWKVGVKGKGMGGKKGRLSNVRDITPLLRSVGPRWTRGRGVVRKPIRGQRVRQR